MDIRRFDIIMVDLSGVIGNEQGGIRPVVVIQNDIGNTFSPTTIVMPLTKKIKNLGQPTHTLIKSNADSGLKMDSMLLGEQMRVISNQRIISKVGSIVDENERSAVRNVYLASFGD